MTEEELMQKYRKEYEYLNTKCIYELRTLAKQLGARLPSVQKKKDLILHIIKIGTGTVPIQRKKGEEAEQSMVLFQDDPEKSEKFALSLTKEELKLLSAFSYIGTRVFNYYRKPQDIDIEYFEFADKIYAHYYAAEKGLSSADEVEESEIASIGNGMEVELCDDITFFENELFQEMLAERLADKNYPLRDGEDPLNHYNAIEIYLEKLEEKGLSFVDFVAPSIENEVRARFIPIPEELSDK